jgi:hypothetical protein
VISWSSQVLPSGSLNEAVGDDQLHVLSGARLGCRDTRPEGDRATRVSGRQLDRPDVVAEVEVRVQPPSEALVEGFRPSGSHAPLSFQLVTLFTVGGVLLALTTVVLVVAQTQPNIKLPHSGPQSDYSQRRLALRPERSAQVRMPPTARSAPRGGRPGLLVLPAGPVLYPYDGTPPAWWPRRNPD